LLLTLSGDETHEDRTDREEEEEEAAEKKAEAALPSDPLSWFGVLVPPALRTTQGHFVDAVEGPVGKLVGVTTDMRRIEDEVGRARGALARAGNLEE